LFSAYATLPSLLTSEIGPIGLSSGSMNLTEVTVDQLQNFMRSGTLTAQQLTQYYLDRIATLDKKGPKLNAVIELNPYALQLAKHPTPGGSFQYSPLPPFMSYKMIKMRFCSFKNIILIQRSSSHN
jgi:hypothetical protein